jgi:DnaJ-class molecular chaperone
MAIIDKIKAAPRLRFGDPEDIKLRVESENLCTSCKGSGIRLSRAKHNFGKDVDCGWCHGSGVRMPEKKETPVE